MNRTGIVPATFWFLLLLTSMAAWLGSYPLMQPDEGRNAEVAREMLASGDYLVPHLNGLPYVDKPVLHFAIAGASMRALGVNELAVRLPSLIFTVLTALVIGLFGRRLWGPEVGWTAAALLLASPLTFVMSRVVILDAVLALFVLTSLTSLYLAIEGRAARLAVDPQSATAEPPWRRWSIVAWLAIGLGIVTKGPVALLIPLLVGLPFGFHRRALRAVVYPPAVALGLVVVVPWVVRMTHELPDYLHYVLVTETWRRISSDQLHRSQPFWYFVPVILAGAFPWTCMLVAALWRRGRSRLRPTDPRIVFLVLWIALPFVFFSLSRSKLPHYMLPLMPAIALLAAVLLCGTERDSPPGRAAVSVLWGVFGALLIGAALLSHRFAGVDPAILAAASTCAFTLGATAIVAGAFGFFAKPRGLVLVAVFSLPVLCFGLAGGPLMKAVGSGRSAYALARAIQQRVPGERMVIGVGAFPTTLPFYLGAPIYVSSATGRELTSNYVVADYSRLVSAPGSTLRDATWWQAVLADCRSPAVFVIANGNAEGARILRSAGLPQIAADRKFQVYGPCQVAGSPTASGGAG
jgi:4-amino-4-deoxy-L-arabinose transferase-like glycosyltransferase